MSGLTILIRMDSLCRKCLNNVPYEKKVIFIFMCVVVRFVYEFKYLHKRDLDAIYDLLKAVHSPLAASFWELKESWSIGNLERVLAAHGYRVQDLDCYKHLMGFAK